VFCFRDETISSVAEGNSRFSREGIEHGKADIVTGIAVLVANIAQANYQIFHVACRL
jgi:hypothetical protein